MAEPTATAPQSQRESGVLAEVRARRAGLRRAMTDAEVAAAAPLGGREQAWQTGLLSCLNALVDAWQHHITATESDDGLFAQIRDDAPQLAPSLTRLHREHERLLAAMAGTRDSVANDSGEPAMQAARDQLVDLLAKLARHRQRGSDLLYAAYQVDVGGE